MIIIYSDASVSKTGKAVACCIVLQNNSFVGYTTFCDCPGDNSLIAEVYGTVSALEYTMDVCKNFKDETVVVLTDSMEVVKSLSQRHDKIDPALNVLETKLCRLVDKYNIKVELYKGHQLKHNPNKFVDYNARRKMRSIESGEKNTR